MTAALPAMELAIPQSDAAHAMKRRLGIDHTRCQRRHGDGHFEDGARGVLACDGLVAQRRALIIDELAPVLGRQAAAKGIGIVGGRRDQAQNVSRVHIDNDHGAAFLGQPFGGEALQRHIQRQHQLAAALSLLALQLTNDAAQGIDLQMARSRPAAQGQIVLPLDAILADAKPGQLQQRIAREILFRHGGDVAEHVRSGIGVRVKTPLADIDAHPRQVRRIDLDARHPLPAQEFLHGDGHEFPLAPNLAQDARPFILGKHDNPGQPIQRLLDVGRVLRGNQHAVVLLIDGQRHAEPVDYVSARRWQQAQIDPVLVGEHGVALRLDNLQIVHSPGQRAE